MLSINEKRTMERFPLEVPSKITILNDSEEGETFELMTSNVCAGGAFFNTARSLPIGTEVKVDMIPPFDALIKSEGKKVHIKIFGEVIRNNSTGMAISFEKNYKIKSLPIY